LGSKCFLHRPENEITREELITIFVLYANRQPDVLVETNAEGWSNDYIDIAVSIGYVVGYPDGSLHLNDPMTRAHSTTMINRIFNCAFDKEAVSEQEFPYTDITEVHWAYMEIVEGAVTHNYIRVNGNEKLIRFDF